MTASVQLAGRTLLDAPSLAARMNVGRTTVWRLAKEGKIPYYAIGRRWYFDEEEVLNALRVARPGFSNGNVPTQLSARTADRPTR